MPSTTVARTWAFPLDRGSVADGILTCHWHQARFDLASGCTFDLFADDVPTHDVRVVDGVVHVSTRPRQAQGATYHGARLRRGIEQNVPLVQAKSLLGLLERGAFDRVVAEAGSYAAERIAGFSEGMVRLTCVANLRPHLSEETTYHALLFAVRQIAQEALASCTTLEARCPRHRPARPCDAAPLAPTVGSNAPTPMLRNARC